MTARETAIENMRDAFTLWEEESRAHPDTFMDDAAQRAKTPGDLGELRAIYFADLCDKVRARKDNAHADGSAVADTVRRDVRHGGGDA